MAFTMVMMEAMPSCSIHHHHLLLLPLVILLMFAAAGSGVHCIGDKTKTKKLVINVSLEELRWGRRYSLSRPSWMSQPRSRRKKDVVVLEMRHHRHSSSSKPISTQQDKLELILASDHSRLSSLHSQLNNNPVSISDAQIPLSSGAMLQTLNYIADVELGTTKMTLIVDTGSDLTWAQCEPCASCYNQQDPVFDPSASPSYQPVPCNSPTCSSLQFSADCSPPGPTNQPASCDYDVTYGDGSYTRGVLARDQINLAGTVVEAFVFGCGQSNSGMFGGTSGLMGLGRNELSLVSQTLPQFGGVFSYCLPNKEFNSSGSLILGSNFSSTYRNSTPVVYTRMIADPNQSSFYFLNLTGMSIGGQALQASGFSSGSKIIIDSGTVITRLPSAVYEALKKEFLRQFSQYPVAPGFSILDTCFDLSGNGNVELPTMKLEFEGGVEVTVDVTGILYFIKSDASQVCLAFTQPTYEDEVGILGNYQQKNLRVVYDTVESKVGFAEEICGYI